MVPRLPIGYRVAPNVKVGRALESGHGWQTAESEDGQATLLLMEANSKLAGAVRALSTAMTVSEFDYGGEGWVCGIFPASKPPRCIGPMSRRRMRPSEAELEAICNALRVLREEFPSLSWETAIWMPSLGLCVSDGTTAAADEDRHGLLVRLLGRGIELEERNPELIGFITGWRADFVAKVLAVAENGFGSKTPIRRASGPASVKVRSGTASNGGTREPFSLPGRPALERIIAERIVSYFADRGAYERMGVKPPNGVLLYGPPGSGKTHAARLLAQHLGWRSFEIDLGSVGSPYIHQTSARLRKVFEAAASAAPAIIIMDEADALLGDRSNTGQEWKVEETAQMLALLERAAEMGILILATTNRRDAIDPALLRKGRLDIQVEVGMPMADEIEAALSWDLNRRPIGPGLDIRPVAARLAGRPMSDAAWVANEAARLAVLQGKDRIDQICLLGALRNLG